MALMARKKVKTEPTYIRLPVDLKADLERVADKNRRTLSVEATIAIEQYLDALGERTNKPKSE